MSVFHTNALAGASGRQGAGGAAQYQIQRSLRFNSADSAYLIRTPSTTGNRQTFTWSCWAKCVADTGERAMYGAGQLAPNYQSFISFSSGKLRVFHFNGSAATCDLVSTAVFRDYASWMHVVVQVDTTQATASNRVRIYVNNQELTSFTTSTYPGLNDTFWFNTASIGQSVGGMAGYSPGTYPFNGYLAECYLIDGQALTPSSFGETDATTGEWIPKAYTGTYGTNGFKLNFADNSAATAAALGKDTSNNGNNYTPNNLSVTAGVGNDSMVDTPTSYGTDTGVGGEVRGNYCTWNPVGVSNYGATAWPIVNGALDANDNTSGIYGVVPGTMAVSSGKWYWEVTVTTGLSVIDFYAGLGIELASITENRYKGSYGSCYYYNGDGSKNVGITTSAYGTAWTSGNVIGVALDLTANTITFYRNNTTQGAISIAAGEYRPVVGDFSNGTGTNFSANFGQRPFAYTAPSGFKALCDTNLPTPTIVKPSTVMDTVLYTGTGASLTPTSSLGFSPDLVWIKCRSGATDHALYDTVRGTTLDLVSNSGAAETTQAQGLTAFNSNGFTVGTLAKLNTSTATYVAWCWDAGSSTVVNSQGTLGGSIRANASAGFSIVQFVSPSAGNATVGHGLGVAPSLIIAKNQVGNSNWTVYHSSATTISQYLVLNGTSAVTTLTNVWGNASPTSTVFGINSSNQGASTTCIAYCFAPVAGYSAFGSYTGNGSADGPFVYTGFRPRWILFKQSGAVSGWAVFDAARNPYNLSNLKLQPHTTSMESVDTSTNSPVDILSNGFKLRGSGSDGNASAGTYIYAAFAEFPFQFSRAR